MVSWSLLLGAGFRSLLWLHYERLLLLLGRGGGGLGVGQVVADEGAQPQLVAALKHGGTGGHGMRVGEGPASGDGRGGAEALLAAAHLRRWTAAAGRVVLRDLEGG